MNSVWEKLGSALERLAAIGNYDFCPWLNRYVYWLKQPIGWFAAAALAAGLTGAFVASQAWVVCAAVLIVMALGTAWPWLAMRGLTAELAFDRRRRHELDAVTVSLTVVNRWPWPVWGLLVERGFFDAPEQDGHSQEEAATALARIAAWSKSRFEFTYHPPRRGVFPHQPPVLATGFPFGIWTATQPISVAQQLIAWPRCAALRSLPALAGERLAAAGSFVDRAGHDGDILAARPYVQGDSPRRVHWVHTARRDTLIVCERQTASRRSVLVVLDRRAFEAEANGQDAWDWSLRVVASLCREFHRHACDVTCELNGQRFVAPPSTVGLHRLFDRLAAFQPEAATSSDEEPSRADASDALTIFVTSAARWRDARKERGWRRRASVRAVVLDADDEPPIDAPRPWIRLQLAGDPLRQLQQQWERRCHDDWAQ